MTNSHVVTVCRGGDFFPSEERIRHLEETLRGFEEHTAVRLCSAEHWREQEQADTSIFFGWPTDEMLERMPALEWVQLPSAGAAAYVNHPKLAETVQVTTASDVFGIAGAEHTLALLFALARGMRSHVESTLERTWRKHERSFEIHGSTVGVFGLGSIGREVAKRLKALGARVIGVKRHADGDTPDYLAELHSTDSADAVLARCDTVVLAMPETPETRGFLDQARMNRMKPEALLVNVGRGSAVDQGALLAALESGRIAGAALDVTTPEPLPPDDPLWRAGNVIITSHSMNIFDRKDERRIELFAENFRRYVSGAPLLNLVDHVRGY